MTLVRLMPRPHPVAEPVTEPLPRLSDIVHTVTATFHATGWTLRFGPTGARVHVRRLADADSAARDLVAAHLGLPPAAVRVRIAPDRETVRSRRRGTPSRRVRSHEV